MVFLRKLYSLLKVLLGSFSFKKSCDAFHHSYAPKNSKMTLMASSMVRGSWKR